MSPPTWPDDAVDVFDAEFHDDLKPESEFQRKLIEYATNLGWLCFSVGRSDLGVVTNQGFHDVVMIGQIVIFAELKVRGGKLTNHQQKWQDAVTKVQARGIRDFKFADVRSEVWYPRDRARFRSLLQHFADPSLIPNAF